MPSNLKNSVSFSYLCYTHTQLCIDRDSYSCVMLLHVVWIYVQGFIQKGGNWDFPPPPPPPRIYENFIIIEKSVQIVNDDKYPLTFPRFVNASIDFPPKPKILYETLMCDSVFNNIISTKLNDCGCGLMYHMKPYIGPYQSTHSVYQSHHCALHVQDQPPLELKTPLTCNDCTQ